MTRGQRVGQRGVAGFDDEGDLALDVQAGSPQPVRALRARRVADPAGAGASAILGRNPARPSIRRTLAGSPDRGVQCGCGPRGLEVPMVEVGDRVVLESEKVGVEPRSGLITAVEGMIVHVRWDSGRESSFVPTAGSMAVVGRATDAPTVT
jgi:hypothetical protein